MTAILLALAVSATPLSDGDALAVVPLRTQTLSPKVTAVLDNLLVATVDDATSARVISPADIDTVLGVERTREAAGCDDLRCAAEIAGALGARYLLSGTADVLGDRFVLTLALIDTRETTVVARKHWQGGNDESRYVGAVESTVREIFAGPPSAEVAVSTTVPAGAASPTVAGKEFGARLIYLDKGEWLALGAEYGVVHSPHLATVARLGAAGFGAVGGDVVGLLLGVSEELRYTLHRTRNGRRALEAFASADINATIASFPALQGGGSVGLRFYWISLRAALAYQLAGDVERTTYDSQSSTNTAYSVPMAGVTAGVSAGLDFEL